MKARIQAIIKELQVEFPGKNIVLLPSIDPREIICEIESGEDESVAIAYIKSSEPHFHIKSQETYEVEKGELTLINEDKKYFLNNGDKYIVNQGNVHSAKGQWTRVRVKSVPGWSQKDHILV